MADVSLEQAMAPVLALAPRDVAMARLVVSPTTGAAAGPLADAVDNLLNQPPFADRPALAAGLWLFVDELDRSHAISQHLDSPTGAFWHGIMHRREGDFANSHYWFRQVGDHPAFQAIEPAYDPHAFIDQVEAVHQGSQDDGQASSLIDRQRREWWTLMSWSAQPEQA